MSGAISSLRVRYFWPIPVSLMFSLVGYGAAILGSRVGLNIKNHVYISDAFARRLNSQSPDELIGSLLAPSYSADESIRFVIDGIYEDFPDNSSYGKADIIFAMPSIVLYTWDGTNNWLGNDRYCSYVKLAPGSSPEQVDEAITHMCNENLPIEKFKSQGVWLSFHIEPLETYHIKLSYVAKVCTMMLVMALVVLMAATLNYVLVSISAMVHKAKMVAVRRCYGATTGNIYSIVFSEAFANLLVSLALAIWLLLLFRVQIEQLIGAPLAGLISGGGVTILLVVCCFVLLICGVLPGMVYTKIPVAVAFRRYSESSRLWNMVLLFVQFTLSAFFVSLLLVMVMQYDRMVNNNPGYEYRNVVMVNLDHAYLTKKDLVREQVAALPFVEMVTSCSELPLGHPSGNSVKLIGDDREYFNIADMYFVGDDYFELFEIPIIDGRNFTQGSEVTREIMVSRSFVEKMEQMSLWSDGAVGKSILITEHSQGADESFTICGVYEDYLIGSHASMDTRPSVQFYGGADMEHENSYYSRDMLVIKLREVTPQNVEAISQIINGVNPEALSPVLYYSNEMVALYDDSLNVRNIILVSGFIMLFITLMGLLGYTQDEINRRRSEIAIRKINGAALWEMLRLFVVNVLKWAIPATVLGSVCAYVASEAMLELYALKIALSWWIFTLCGIFVLLLISAVVFLKSYSAINTNPVKNLRTE